MKHQTFSLLQSCKLWTDHQSFFQVHFLIHQTLRHSWLLRPWFSMPSWLSFSMSSHRASLSVGPVHLCAWRFVLPFPPMTMLLLLSTAVVVDPILIQWRLLTFSTIVFADCLWPHASEFYGHEVILTSGGYYIAMSPYTVSLLQGLFTPVRLKPGESGWMLNLMSVLSHLAGPILDWKRIQWAQFCGVLLLQQGFPTKWVTSLRLHS